MTIKGKLTLNIIIVLAVIAVVAAGSIVGMGFVKSKLSYLTEKSTPFQTRTVEFQKAMQGAIADLTTLSNSKNIAEYQTLRSESEKSLAEVKSAQDALESLSGGDKSNAYSEFNNIASELLKITRERLKAEEDESAAQKGITQKLRDATAKLNELGSIIKDIRLNRSKSFLASRESAGNTLSNLKNVDALRSLLKDLQIALVNLQNLNDRKRLPLVKAKILNLIANASENESLKELKKLQDEIKSLRGKADELIKARAAVLDQPGEEGQKKYQALNKELFEKISDQIISVEQEHGLAGAKYDNETVTQNTLYTQMAGSNDILSYNNDLFAQGKSVELSVKGLFTAGSPDEIRTIESEIKKAYEQINATRQKIEKAMVLIDAKRELKILQNANSSLHEIRGLLFAKDGVIAKINNKLVMRDKAAQATGRLRAIVLEHARKGKETITAARGEQEKAIGTVNKMVRYNIVLISAITAGAIALGIVFGVWIYRSIARPLHQLISISDKVAHGDLKSDISISTKDEFGTVQSSMATMVTSLRDILGKITTATATLASSSEELAATATTLEKGSQEQSAQTEQSATAMAQMSQTTLDVAKNASSTSSAAQTMKQTALHGKETMDRTVKELIRFADTVKDSAAKVESLGQKSDEINNVISLIKEIADQTNLLALNAAIEAARAGDMGRGFAVVADNVRQLAERTAGATDDIAHTVTSMQSEVHDSVSFMKEERESVEKVIEHVKDTLGAIDGIVTYVEQVADMVQRIAAATEEQSSASEEVSHNMENIAEITRRLGSSVVEIKRTSGELSRFASELNTMAGWFKT